MDNKGAIGVIDSGVGGVTVWSEIRKLLPDEDTIYYADTANCPYGNKSYEDITDLGRHIVKLLLARGVKLIVIACNTMTAASISTLREEFPNISFVGMEPAVKPAAMLTKSKVIGILATAGTLQGDLYHNTLRKIDSEISVIERVGEGLVELVEKGKENSEEADKILRGHIEPMLASDVDCLVLGCTHYPFLTSTINQISVGRLQVINPAGAIARRVKQLLREENLLNDTKVRVSEHCFMSSLGEEASRKVKRRGEEYLASIL